MIVDGGLVGDDGQSEWWFLGKVVVVVEVVVVVVEVGCGGC